jgi:hypothetical protein
MINNDILSYCISDIYKEYKNKAIKNEKKQSLSKDIETIIRLQADTKSYINMLSTKIYWISKELNKSYHQVANILLKNHIISITDYDKALRRYEEIIYRPKNYTSF